MRPSRQPERGGSVVVAVVSLPLLLTFLFAAIDLGRVVFLSAEAGTAAHAACRRAAERPDAAASPDELWEAALAAAPSLAAEGLDLSVAVEVGGAVEREFAYRLRDEAGGGFSVQRVVARTRSVRATLSVRGRYLTPLGVLLPTEKDGASFVCEAQAHGSADETAAGAGS